jgi:DNA invertase Pin-like site-specific DNA recombinase
MSPDTQTLDREMAELQARLTELRRIRYAGDRAARKAKIEQSPRVQSIKKYYLANHASIAEIARAYNTSEGAIQALVRKYDWPRRSPPKVLGQKRRRAAEAR